MARKKRVFIWGMCILIVSSGRNIVSAGNLGGADISSTDLLSIGGVSKNSFILLASDYEQQLKEAEETKKKLEERKKDTQNKIKELEADKKDLLLYIEKLDKQLNDITLKLEELSKEIEDTTTQLEQTKIDLEIAKKTEQEQYETMKQRIQYMYENGTENYLELFMNAESLSGLLNQIEYVSQIIEYDNQLLNRYKETKEKVILHQSKLESELDELNVLEESALFEKDTMESLAAEKTKEIVRYTESIGISEELLTEYSEEITSQSMKIEDIRAEEQRRIEEEEQKQREEKERLEKIEEERRKQEEEDRKNGAANVEVSDEFSTNKMIWPLPGDGRIFSYFGARTAPTAGASTYHRGLDIGGEFGASIVASLSGTVETASYSVTSGNYVIVNHGNGFRTAYLHCSKILVSVGDKVKQGQTIALVGNTGVSTGPHLHFGVSINGTYVDPQSYIHYN